MKGTRCGCVHRHNDLYFSAFIHVPLHRVRAPLCNGCRAAWSCFFDRRGDMPERDADRTLQAMDSIQPLTPPASFVKSVTDLGIEFERGEVEKLGLYLALLLDANTRFNLTAITDPEK